VQEDYRGHLIRLIEGVLWRAELVERDTGAMLPTMVTASMDEGVEVCAERARELIDRYLEAEVMVDRRRRLGDAPSHLKLIRP
jgi:hypothetical protein